MTNVFTTTPENIVGILTQRFGQGDPGSGLSMDTHEAHMLMAYLHQPSLGRGLAPEGDDKAAFECCHDCPDRVVCLRGLRCMFWQVKKFMGGATGPSHICRVNIHGTDLDHCEICGKLSPGDPEGERPEPLIEAIKAMAPGYQQRTKADGCINCGEANDGGYETSDGNVGSFCAQCWECLREEFQVIYYRHDIDCPARAEGVCNCDLPKRLAERKKVAPEGERRPPFVRYECACGHSITSHNPTDGSGHCRFCACQKFDHAAALPRSPAPKSEAKP